jgi:phosphatidylglycerol:prolipoprotein diacylglycerol transferase
VLGFFLSTWLACLEAKRRGYDPNIVLDFAMPLLLISILCCRVLYFLVYPEAWQGMGTVFSDLARRLELSRRLRRRLGTLGYFAWKRKVPFGTICDFVAPGMFLGYAIGRVGCFANGCCYGHPTDVLWACVFPVEGNRTLFTLPSHPAQLYSTLMGLGIFGVMWSIRGKPAFNRFPGQLSILLGAFYAVERFVMEIFRSGATAPVAFGWEWLTRAQFASVVALVVLGALWWALSRRSVRVVRGGDSPHVPAG